MRRYSKGSYVRVGKSRNATERYMCAWACERGRKRENERVDYSLFIAERRRREQETRHAPRRPRFPELYCIPSILFSPDNPHAGPLFDLPDGQVFYLFSSSLRTATFSFPSRLAGMWVISREITRTRTLLNFLMVMTLLGIYLLSH